MKGLKKPHDHQNLSGIRASTMPSDDKPGCREPEVHQLSWKNLPGAIQLLPHYSSNYARLISPTNTISLSSNELKINISH
jgi:hypothetical protein